MNQLRSPDNRLLIASLQKGLQALEWIQNHGESVGVQQIADALGLTKSNAQRILHTLWQQDYLAQDADTHRYRLSLKLNLSGYARFQNTEIFRLAQEQLLKLGYETGETCALVMLDGWDAVIVQVVTGRFAHSVNLRVGMRLDAAQVTSGRLLLAFHSPAARAWLAADTEDSDQVQTRLQHLSQLEQEFLQTRKRGYLATVGAIFAENASLSAPILDAAGHIRAAINSSMHVTRYRALGQRYLVQLVKTAAARVSSDLGFTPDAHPKEEQDAN